jgi:DNA (cytosine-5)-methyltransferase 1
MKLEVSRNQPNPFTFVDLFSGCGGFSHGLEKSGLKCLLGVDHNEDAISTFRLNHPSSNTYFGDIRDLDDEMVTRILSGQEVDLVVGGPPCQGFSTVGRGDVDDPRNFLFLEFVRIVNLIKPKGIVIENVTGLLAKKNAEIVAQIFSMFQELGYTLEARILLAEDYGVPQRRRRAVIIGFRDGFKVSFPESILTNEQRYQTVGDAFRGINYEDKHHSVSDSSIRSDVDIQRLSHIPQGCGIRYKKDQEKYLPRNLYFDIDWDNLDEGRFRQTKLQRLDFNAPAPTLLTSKNTYYHPLENRYLTIREAASIQSFPNDFNFCGSMSSVFKQIGNAVPVKMAEAIGKELINSLNGMC